MAALTTDEKIGLRRGILLTHDRAGRYWEVARLVFSDSLWRFRRRLGGLLVISGAALALQAGALAAFVVYARRLESGTGIEIAGLAIDPTSSLALLAAAVAAGGALFVLASFLQLYVARGFYDVAWRYGLFCSERLLTLASAALHRTSRDGLRLDEAEIRQMALSRPVLCSRVLNRLMSSLPLAASLVVFSAFLLYLDLKLTFVVLAIVLASTFFFYGLSVQASKFIPLREEKARAMSADYKRLLDFMRASSRPLAAGHPLLTGLVRQGSFAAFFAQRFRPQILAARSVHVGTITLAVALTVVGLVKGGEIIASGTGFGDLIVFLIAGRMAMSSIAGIMNALVRINVYYPRVAGYFRMVERLQAVTRADAAIDPPRPGWTFRLTAKRLSDKPGPLVTLLPGQRLGLITPRPADRFALIEAAGGLRLQQEGAEGGQRRVAPALCWLVPEVPVRASGVSFAEATGLPSDLDTATLGRELARLGLPPEALATIPADRAAEMDAQGWARVDAAALSGAALVAASHAGHPLVAIGAETLRALGPDAARTVIEQLLGNRVMLITYRPGDAKKLGEFGERYALLYDSDSLLGYLPVADVGSRFDFIKGMERARKQRDEMGDDMLMDEEM